MKTETMELTNIVEGLLFAADGALKVTDIQRAIKAAADNDSEDTAFPFAEVKPKEIETAIENLQSRYDESGSALTLVEGAKGWKILTRPELADIIRELYPDEKPSRLSGPALETLAIIAYRQPITKAEVEAVRGVSVDGVLQTLLDRGIVKIAGRAETPGRPLLYETTELFLDHFGLKGVNELPNADELRRVELPAPDVPVVEAEPSSDESDESEESEESDESASEEPDPAPEAEAQETEETPKNEGKETP